MLVITKLKNRNTEQQFTFQIKFCVSFGNQVPGVRGRCGEVQNPKCLKSIVKFMQFVMICDAGLSPGVLSSPKSTYVSTRRF